MYVQHYILFNNKNQNYHRIHHTPEHNPYMLKTIRCYQRKHRLKNWMKIIKTTPENCWGIPILCQSHRPNNANSTKLTGDGIDKANNRNRNTYNSVFKLKRDTSICSNRIQNKHNDSSHIFVCIL